MEFYQLELCGLKRKLPIVALGPKIKVASFNLLGDVELVKAAAGALAKKLEVYDFDFLVGPEVKVVPLLQELSKLLGKERYIICRKNIMGYMVKPLITRTKPHLVLDGVDQERLNNKKVAIVDDVVSTGRTIKVVKELMKQAEAEVSCVATVLKQGKVRDLEGDIIFLEQLPVFKP